MYTYILTVLILFVIASCIKTSFPKNFILIGCAIVSMAVLVVVNCIYYGVNYYTMETHKKVKTEIVQDDDIKISLRQDTIIRLKISGNFYDINVKSPKQSGVYLDTINCITTTKYEFIGENKWMLISSYPFKNINHNIGLNKEKYDIFKTYQDSICKRENTLSKNGKTIL